MKSQNHVFCIFAGLLITLMTGCASPRPDIDVAIVTQTLQSYQVGKTTFADFKRDAGLKIVARPDPAPAPPVPLNSGYILYPPPAWNPRMQMLYVLPQGSPWRIYGVQHYTNMMSRESSRTERFVVGDIDHPISILIFGGDGSLLSISDAR